MFFFFTALAHMNLKSHMRVCVCVCGCKHAFVLLRQGDILLPAQGYRYATLRMERQRMHAHTHTHTHTLHTPVFEILQYRGQGKQNTSPPPQGHTRHLLAGVCC